MADSASHRRRLALVALTVLGGAAWHTLKEYGADPVMAAALPAFPMLGAVAEVIAEFHTHFLHGILEKGDEAREAAEGLLTNGHIAAVQAAAIRRRLRHAAERLTEPQNGPQRKRLEEIADASPKWWIKLVQEPARHELEALRDKQSIELIVAHVRGDAPPVLKIQQWMDLLREADNFDERPSLDENIFPSIARVLEENLTTDFFQAVKADLATDGKAFAAVSLRFSGEILLNIRAIAVSQKELAGQTRETLQSFLRILPELDEQLKGISEAARRLQSIPDLEATLRISLSKFDSRVMVQLTRMEGKLDQILAIVQHTLASTPDRLALKLEMWSPIRLRNDQPSLWLQAYNALVPMTGREPEIEELSKMLRTEGLFRWWVFFGEAGMGKTRLALEFAKQTISEGWIAGFLTGNNLRSFVAADLAAAWRPRMPTLIVVDYAASKVNDLRRLFEHLAAIEVEAERGKNQSAIPPVRVLLLERHADDTRGWLKELLAAGESITGNLLSSVCYIGLRKLQPPAGGTANAIATADFTRQIIVNTFERWAEITGRQPPQLPEFNEKEWRTIQLRTGNRPLYLQMAAIHACERRSAVLLPNWGRGELLLSAVAREREYVKRECAGDFDLCKAVEHVTAILCLAGTGAVSGRQWNQIIREELQAIGVSHPPNQVEHYRRAIFAEGQTGISEVETGIIQPDILSEGFAAQVLRAEEGAPPTEALKQILKLSGVKAWANLIRMVQDLVGIEADLFRNVQIESIDSWLPPLLVDRPVAELHQLVHVIPDRSILLHRFALLLSEHLLTKVPESNIADRAACLLSLGTHRCRLSKANRDEIEKAVRELEAAIRLFDTLSLDDDKKGCRRDLAKAHRLLDNALFSLGRNEDALRHSWLAVQLSSGEYVSRLEAPSIPDETAIEQLLSPDEQDLKSEQAQCLNCLAINLNSLKQSSLALKVGKKAVEASESLAAHNWSHYAAYVVRSLNTLSQTHQLCGNVSAALECNRRSVQIGEEIARENPDEYALSFSRSLSGLVALEYSQKNTSAAQGAIEKLIALYEELSSRDPSSYRAELAQSYHNIGYLCDENGDKTDGIRYTLDGLNIREELLESDFDAIALALAWSHYNVGCMYRDVGDQVNAQQHFERAYALRLKWVESTPGRHLPELSKCANSLATLFREKNDYESEVIWLERVVRHYESGDLPPGERAMAAHTLAEALGRLGRTSEAAAAATIAAKGFREQFNICTPEDDLQSWAEAGCNFASALALQGDWNNDGDALAQAIRISQQVLARITPSDRALGFVWGALMNNLGHAQFRQGEILGQIEGVRQGIESLKASMEHHLKQDNKSAAEETRQLFVQAQKLLEKSQNVSDSSQIPASETVSKSSGK